ncbi:hypothetical protein J5N97_026355 [Dioscorea zingiberensis]|uniref:Uncharacterized protein n=1 Tax=Dioscorea zingiberensis TaxID=325984 RepID=A0A9D5C3D9_9LILI|nr:hypothetical protein J5N97_026355 [Dioscorea zingiberensis]
MATQMSKKRKKKDVGYDLMKELDALRSAKSLLVERNTTAVRRFSMRDCASFFLFASSCAFLGLTSDPCLLNALPVNFELQFLAHLLVITTIAFSSQLLLDLGRREAPTLQRSGVRYTQIYNEVEFSSLGMGLVAIGSFRVLPLTRRTTKHGSIPRMILRKSKGIKKLLHFFAGKRFLKRVKLISGGKG